MNDNRAAVPPKFSIPAIISIAAAIASFFTGAMLGLALAVVAVVFGLLGFFLSFSSSRRGGVVSTFAILGGMFGILAAIVKAVTYFF